MGPSAKQLTPHSGAFPTCFTAKDSKLTQQQAAPPSWPETPPVQDHQDPGEITHSVDAERLLLCAVPCVIES